MKTIFLCGFMGCGKSTVGRELSKLLGVRFIDMDIFIEEKEEMTISEIFSKYGEKYFRELEEKAFEELSGKSAVIATGGGALIPEKNAETARKSGVIILIHTEFQTCYDRIRNDKKRPIASKSTREELLELYSARMEIYSRHSDFSVSGEDTPLNIAFSIQKSIYN